MNAQRGFVDRDGAIIKEFSRQAGPMAGAAAFASSDVLGRILRSLGDPPIGRVLDLACGPGIVAQVVAPLAVELIGVDATPKMVALAEARTRDAGCRNTAFHVAFAENLPFPDSSFDVVVTRLSFHHFEDVSRVLMEIRRVLRPRGRLVAADMVSSAEAAEAELHNAIERLRDPTHVRMLTSTEMRDAVQKTGFELLSHEEWRQSRTFSEWAEIVADPGRTDPLFPVMRALARAGIGAGIELEEAGGELRFKHGWQLVAARRS